MILLLCYALTMCGLSLWAVRRGGGVDSFFVNDRRSSAFGVGMSIVASCVGGSATLGMAGLAWQVGTPAFWWLGSGAAGLVLLSVFLARKVRETGARTMPEMITTYIGAPARPITSVVIVLAWLSILAAQLSAMAAVIAPLAAVSQGTALVMGAALVVGYAAIGGQAAVIRSDSFQYGVLLLALVLALGALLWQRPTALHEVPLQVVNADFTLSKLAYFMCILGGSYVVCPMLFGRLLSARDGQAAVRGGLGAVAGLVATAVLIVALGLACRGLVPADMAPEQVLSAVIVQQLPPWMSAVVMLGVFSAIISSADSCLLTAATVCSNDILRRGDTRTCRWCLLGIGMGGLALAAPGKGILALLLMANDIYVCGVVAPVFVGMILHRRCTFRQNVMALAIAGGGALGLTAALTSHTAFSYAGIAVALCLSLFAARSRRTADISATASAEPVTSSEPVAAGAAIQE